MSGEPENEMALAVLRQALQDACTPFSKAKVEGTTTNAASYEVAQACRFWADTEGEWAESRIAWCDAAGLDPDATRDAALRKIAISRGACILRFPAYRKYFDRIADREERREMAAKVYARRIEGLPIAALQAEFQLEMRELKALLALGGMREKRTQRRQKVAA